MALENDDDTKYDGEVEDVVEDDDTESDDGSESTSGSDDDIEFEMGDQEIVYFYEPDHEAIARNSLHDKIGKVELPLLLLPLECTGELQSLLREAAGSGRLKTDVDAITIGVCDGEAELVVMAMDAQDFDSWAHLPILSLTRKVAYFFVPFTKHLSAVSGESRSVCCVMKGSSCSGDFIQNLLLRTTPTMRAVEPPPLEFENKRGGEEKEDVEALHDELKSKFHVPVLVGTDDVSRSALLMVRDGAFHGAAKIGIDEVTKALCTGSSEFVVMAADAQDLDRMLHLPILAKSKNASYIFVPFSEDLTEKCGLSPGSQRVNVCCVTRERYPTGRLYSGVDVYKKFVHGVLDVHWADSKKAGSGIEPPLKISPFAK